MTKLKKIGVLSSSKLFAVLMGVIGLITGIIYSFGGAIYDVITTGSVNLGTALAFFALIGMPIIFALPGFIIGSIGAFLYNLVADWIGEIEMDFEL